MSEVDGGWQRLDPRMLLIHPVNEIVRFLPALIALVVVGAGSQGPGQWWQSLAVGVPIALGVLRYLTTAYRIDDDVVELRRGLLNRHVLSTPRDRVRTVDITAPPVHRLLGVTRVRVGTGTASHDNDDHLDLDGLPVGGARALRAELLAGRAAAAGGEPGPAPAPEPERLVVALDPTWVRYAPFTSAGLVATAGVLGVGAQTVNTFGGFDRLHPGRIVGEAEAPAWWITVTVLLVLAVVVVSVLSVAGYLVTHWGFRLTRGTGVWHLRRGLLTTRETTLDQHRVRGVSLDEPIGLRLARAGRATAIVTGLGGQGSSDLLIPPAPIDVVGRVAAEVLGADAPVRTPLVGHGPRARTRRYSRTLLPTVVVVAALLVLAALGQLPWWTPAAVAAVALPPAVLLARDRTRSLGHALAGRHLVARSGSLNRRREMLATDAVIGWHLRATWFQRRAGLTTLVATTAGGRQRVEVLDVAEPTALALARDADPRLLGQFLA